MNGLAKWKAVVYLAAIFLAGSVSGYFVAGRMEKQKAAKPLDTQQITREATVSFRDRCHARLNLSPEQAKKIDGIIERFSAKIVATHEEKRARIHQFCEERNSLILAELSPAQKEVFEQMAKERREAWRNKEAGRPRTPGPDRNDRDKPDCGTNAPAASGKLGVTGAISDGLEIQKPYPPR